MSICPGFQRLPSASFALLLSACGGSVENSPGPEFTVRDSAGIRIVEYAGTPTPTHSVTLSGPLYRHGHRVGDYLFTLPWSGALQPDGSAVIGDAMNSEVVMIGSDGALRSILASEGQGPSEVLGATEILVLSQDAVLVYDMRNRRITVFENGVARRSVLMGGSGMRMSGLDEEGRVLMNKTGYTPSFTEPWLRAPLVRFDMKSATYDTVGTYDQVASADVAEWNSPYRPEGKVAVSGGNFVHGRSDRPELVWRDTNGAVRQITRWRVTPTYPTDAHLEEYLQRMREQYRSVGLPAARVEEIIGHSRERLEVDPDEALPLYLPLHGDRDGGVWLGAYVPSAEPRSTAVPSYDLIGPDGVWLGTLESPPGFRVLDVAGDRVLGVLQDELDVESIAVYRLDITPVGS